MVQSVVGLHPKGSRLERGPQAKRVGPVAAARRRAVAIASSIVRRRFAASLKTCAETRAMNPGSARPNCSAAPRASLIAIVGIPAFLAERRHQFTGFRSGPTTWPCEPGGSA